MAQNGKEQDTLNGWRTESMYTFGEAARLTHVSATTVRNWLLGYTVKGREIPPLFPSGNGAMVSFLQMIEVMVAGRFRKSTLRRRVSFRTVRDAHVNARELMGIEYPFAHMKLDAMGGHVVRFLEVGPEASHPALDAPGQWTLPGLLRETIDQLEYDDDHALAARWFPVGKTVPIVVDPRISTGLPVIEGRGVTIQTIRKRFVSGLNIDFIAKDFDLDRDLVETALRYWDRVAA